MGTRILVGLGLAGILLMVPLGFSVHALQAARRAWRHRFDPSLRMPLPPLGCRSKNLVDFPDRITK